jgi:hypothetical protein
MLSNKNRSCHYNHSAPAWQPDLTRAGRISFLSLLIFIQGWSPDLHSQSGIPTDSNETVTSSRSAYRSKNTISAPFAGALCQGAQLIQERAGHSVMALSREAAAGFRPCQGGSMQPQSSHESEELYLSFDQPSHAMTDSSGHYKVNSADFQSIEGYQGQAAHFFRLRHKVILANAPGSLFSNGTMPSFTFAFRIWIDRAHSGVLLSRISRSGGRRQSMELKLVNGAVRFESRGLFHLRTGTDSHSSLPGGFQITSRSRIRLHTWEHVTVAWNQNTGRMVILIGGRETASRYTTVSGNSDGNIYRPVFSGIDAPPLVIGSHFYGRLDEFHVYRRYLVDDSGLGHSIQTTPYPEARLDYIHQLRHQPRGEIRSRVLQSRYSHAMLQSIEAKLHTPPGTHGYLEARMSDKRFRALDESRAPAWKRLPNQDRNVGSGHFFQWRVILFPSPDGSRSPRLEGISLSLSEDIPPVQPRNLRVIGELSLNGKICLEWTRNPEQDVRMSGGYNIYYGHRPGQYQGRIQYTLNKGRLQLINQSSQPLRKTSRGWIAKSSLLTSMEQKTVSSNPVLRERLQNTIRVLIDNDLLQAQMNHNGEQMPLLQPDTVYYFAVSAWDRRKPADRESKTGNEVSAVSIPSQGYKPALGYNTFGSQSRNSSPE